MSFSGTGKIWMNGSLVDWADARIHIASHVIHYGSGVFEGARCYDTPQGSACLRLDTHLDRLLSSAKVYRMDCPYTAKQLETAVLETIRANSFKSCYIRPLVYRGYHALGVNPLSCPVDVAIMVWEWGAYLGPEALDKGVDVCISSVTGWPRHVSSLAKASGSYANAAHQDGSRAERLTKASLDTFRCVGGGRRNIFVAQDGVLYTPPWRVGYVGSPVTSS